jgi:hypothetical protein
MSAAGYVGYTNFAGILDIFLRKSPLRRDQWGRGCQRSRSALANNAGSTFPPETTATVRPVATAGCSR